MNELQPVYSVIPVVILAIVVLLLLIIGKKKDNDYFKYNYFIKILLVIIIGLVLPLIAGYTIWICERFSGSSSLYSNLVYIALLVGLIIALIALLIVICKKFLKGIKGSQEYVN